MVTEYFDIYRKKVDVKNLEKLIKDKEDKMIEYDAFLTSSAGSSLMINRLMSRNYIMTEKAKAQDEEEKKKIETDYALEFLALDDMEKNIHRLFDKEIKKELSKEVKLYTRDNNYDVPKNLDYLTALAIKGDNDLFANKFLEFINVMFYSLDKGGYTQPINPSRFADSRYVKALFKYIMNNMYKESLNAVSVDYVKPSNENINDGNTVNINSIPAGI